MQWFSMANKYSTEKMFYFFIAKILLLEKTKGVFDTVSVHGLHV